MKFLITLITVVSLFAGSNAFAELDSAISVAERMGLSPAAIEQVKRGEIVSEELEASSDKDLSLAIVMRLDATPGEVFDFVNADHLVELQTVRLSGGAIDPANPSLAELQLPADLEKALAEDPGETFFMSAKEAKQVSDAGKRGTAQALDAYRQVLAARAKAYWEGGIAAITPYAGEDRSPHVDLGHANEVARALVKNSTFLAELDAPPAESSGKAIHKLSWAVEKGRDQAAPVLIHQILYREGDGEILLERRFYSGYDYDALQIVVGVLPTKPGSSAVFYTNHTYTAQVTGFGGRAKRSIGRKLLKKEVVAQMERARDAIPER